MEKLNITKTPSRKAAEGQMEREYHTSGSSFKIAWAGDESTQAQDGHGTSSSSSIWFGKYKNTFLRAKPGQN